VPLLALGLPVTATATIMLAAFQSYGIQPGPQLMTEQSDLVWTLLASLLIGNTLLLVLNLPLAPLWARLLRIPRPYLYAGILFFASLGAYTANLEAFDLFLLLVFGLLGLAMRRFALPVLPLILGVILGPLMETKLREALTISDGDPSGLVNEPLAIVVYVIIALLLAVPLVLRRLRPDLEPAALVPPDDAPTPHDDWQEVDR
jgi:putative tricarboxylic transport membrane protein